LVPKSTTLDDLEGPLRTVSKHVRLSEPTTKIWMKIDPYYQRRRCSLMTLDSGNIRFMRIFEGVPWKGGVIQLWDNRKRVFSGFRTLRIRHLRKWGQHYYIVLFSPLLPFTDPKIRDLEWLWIAWMAILRYITYMFTITNGHWFIICYLFTLVVSFVYYTWCDQRRSAGSGV